MDPKAQMPQIKAEVNKVDDGKKKSSGLLGLLGGGGGGGAAGGLGGAAGAAGGGLAAGGLLATKAGMIALIVIGSAVAGGIGLAGYKIFGPSEADKAGGNLSLFAPKPAATADPNAVAPVASDGSSASLNYMAQAAAKEKEGDAAAGAPAAGGDAAAPTDATAGSASASAAADGGSSASTPINSGGGSGAVGSMGKTLANVKKLGALSGTTGGASSSASAANKVGLGDAVQQGARGAISSFGKSGPGAKSNSSLGRSAMGGRGRRSGMGDARMVSKDLQGGKAPSSFAAGRTYDGSTAGGGGAIGPDGGAIGMDGADTGGAAQPKSLQANNAPNVNQQEPPIPKPKKTVSPWSAAIARAQMLVMLAMALVFAASKIPSGTPWTQAALIAIGAVICAIGLYIGVLAGQIMSGKHKQTMQGAVVAAASLGVIATGIGVMISGGKETTGEGGSKGATNTIGGKDGLMGGGVASGFILIGGGVAALAAISTMFMPKPKPIELEEGEKKPDVRLERRADPVRYTV